MLRDFALVIFDCDGVLVDSERLSVEIESRVLGELGWPLTTTEVAARWMGRTESEQVEEIARELGDDRARAYRTRCTELVLRAFDTDLRAVDGVSDLVEALAVFGIATCVASSGTQQRMARTLGVTGLAPQFTGRVFSATEVARGKPAPDLFLHAAASMGVLPGACAVVEDSVPGVQAAVAAGMTAFGYGGGLTDPTLLAGAGAVVVHHLAELLG